jgi:hypothetical protein
MPVDYKTYPSNWRDLRAAVLRRAGNRCEGSPAYPDCRAENGKPHPVSGNRVVLTTAHLFDNDKDTQDIRRLRAWCQRCHLTYDIAKHVAARKESRRRRKKVAV